MAHFVSKVLLLLFCLNSLFSLADTGRADAKLLPVLIGTKPVVFTPTGGAIDLNRGGAKPETIGRILTSSGNTPQKKDESQVFTLMGKDGHPVLKFFVKKGQVFVSSKWDKATNSFKNTYDMNSEERMKGVTYIPDNTTHFNVKVNFFDGKLSLDLNKPKANEVLAHNQHDITIGQQNANAVVGQGDRYFQNTDGSLTELIAENLTTQQGGFLRSHRL